MFAQRALSKSYSKVRLIENIFLPGLEFEGGWYYVVLIFLLPPGPVLLWVKERSMPQSLPGGLSQGSMLSFLSCLTSSWSSWIRPSDVQDKVSPTWGKSKSEVYQARLQSILGFTLWWNYFSTFIVSVNNQTTLFQVQSPSWVRRTWGALAGLL